MDFRVQGRFFMFGEVGPALRLCEPEPGRQGNQY